MSLLAALETLRADAPAAADTGVRRVCVCVCGSVCGCVRILNVRTELNSYFFFVRMRFVAY